MLARLRERWRCRAVARPRPRSVRTPLARSIGRRGALRMSRPRCRWARSAWGWRPVSAAGRPALRRAVRQREIVTTGRDDLAWLDKPDARPRDSLCGRSPCPCERRPLRARLTCYRFRRLGARGAGRRPALVWPFGVRANAREFGGVRVDAASVGGRPAPHQGVGARVTRPARPRRTGEDGLGRLGNFCRRFAGRSDLLNFVVSHG